VLDNFGTGYSSLYHLRNFWLDAVKIDRSFIERVGADRAGAGIVGALVGVGRGLGMSVIAEGVVAPDQGASLLNDGCDRGRGRCSASPCRRPRRVSCSGFAPA
jgi:EAL domain-containing protein (putative c-di-GMP-specific phosphodiesterase class I)